MQRNITLIKLDAMKMCAQNPTLLKKKLIFFSRRETDSALNQHAKV